MKGLDEILKSTLDNLKGMVDTDNVIGKPITGGDGTVILPVSKVSYGFVTGGGEYDSSGSKSQSENFPHAQACGGGVTVTPLGFLICGREKKFLSVDKSTEGNKWMELLKAALKTMKTDED